VIVTGIKAPPPGISVRATAEAKVVVRPSSFGFYRCLDWRRYFDNLRFNYRWC
jgi:hypothetical protein